MTELNLSELLVVVVEPSTTQRHIILRALAKTGIKCPIECENGGAALAALEADPPDLIISSLYLPDMTGTDLIHQIRESDTAPDTPFMLISSETRFRYLDAIRQAGVVGILPKPFTEHELLTALRATLELISETSADFGELPGEELRVLVVDDSSLARKHIARVLYSMGIEKIDHAEDGVQAVEMIGAHYYDFVVTDYNMPRMDGKELLEHIRQHSAQSSMPVLMVTSEENENRLAAIQQSGVSAICDKPFEPAMVRNLIEKMVAG